MSVNSSPNRTERHSSQSGSQDSVCARSDSHSSPASTLSIVSQVSLETAGLLARRRFSGGSAASFPELLRPPLSGGRNSTESPVLPRSPSRIIRVYSPAESPYVAQPASSSDNAAGRVVVLRFRPDESKDPEEASAGSGESDADSPWSGSGSLSGVSSESPLFSPRQPGTRRHSLPHLQLPVKITPPDEIKEESPEESSRSKSSLFSEEERKEDDGIARQVEAMIPMVRSLGSFTPEQAARAAELIDRLSRLNQDPDSIPNAARSLMIEFNGADGVHSSDSETDRSI